MDEISRRQWLSKMCGLLSAIVAALLGVPLLGLSLGTMFHRRKTLWVKVGPISAVKKGEPTKFVYSFLKEDAYLQKTERGTVYVITHDGKNFKVFSNICPHAGCGVRWERQFQAFFCPCHNGKFDINGQVIAGPPPKPLNEIQHKIEGGFIFIKVKA